MSPDDEKYMFRCLQLAKGGTGQVAPNPLVGSVIVLDGRIIGEGYHRQYGGPHAEVHAIGSVKDPSLLSRSTLYVNLEPCSHYGKTPPCAELIIRMGIPRVVIGCLDPFPSVSGRGVRMLREAGVEVITGCLEKEAMEINRIFMTAQLLRRPYILLKWAQSADGFMDKKRDTPDIPPVVFSTPLTSQYIHKRRSEIQAILVGTNTALLDNPSLTVRSWSGESPVRIVIDRELRIPHTALLVDGKVKTLIFTKYERKNENNIEYIPIEFDGNEINQILDYLFKQKISSLMVEGGSDTLSRFLEAGLWDEIQIETSMDPLFEGVKSPCLNQLIDKKGYSTHTNPPYTCYLRRLNSF